MSKRFVISEPFIRLVAESTPQERKSLLRHASKRQLKSLYIVCLNAVRGNLKLAPHVVKRLRRHRKTIETLGDKRVPQREKVRLVNQKGGLLGQVAGLALPVIAQVVASVLRNNKRNKRKAKMKYAERMVLLPETQFHLLQQANSKKRKTKPKNLYKAAIAVSQELGKKIRQGQVQVQKQKERQKNVEKAPNVTVDDIVNELAPIYHAKAKRILAKLAKYGITYTNNQELITANGRVVPNSNITDILKEALVPSKKLKLPKPVGWNDFMIEVAASPIPKSLFTKSSVVKTLTKLQDVDWEDY